MPFLNLLSPSEQVAGHLRNEILRGRWSDTIPGVPTLAVELGVDRKTVDAALRRLEAEGLLVPQGAGRRRRIVLPTEGLTPPALRVAILLREPVDRRLDYIVEIQHLLGEAGHSVVFPETLVELGMNVDRVARSVERTRADAWIIVAASMEVLKWFETQPVPAFALFGFVGDMRLPGTGPIKASAYRDAVRALVSRGHRRIVLLARPQRRLPKPGVSEQAFLDALKAEEIRVGDYNFPLWEDTKAGYQRCLDSLFRVTPPTALVCQEAVLFFAAQQYLSARGLCVPGNVSLVCADPDPIFVWSEPSVAHIRWDSRLILRRVIHWANNISHGKEDLRKRFIRAEFVNGGTIGPVAEG